MEFKQSVCLVGFPFTMGVVKVCRALRAGNPDFRWVCYRRFVFIFAGSLDEAYSIGFEIKRALPKPYRFTVYRLVTQKELHEIRGQTLITYFHGKKL